MQKRQDIRQQSMTAPMAISIPALGVTAKAVDLELTEGEIRYLEEPYVPHALAGVMAQNKPESAKEKHVWSTGNQKI